MTVRSDAIARSAGWPCRGTVSVEPIANASPLASPRARSAASAETPSPSTRNSRISSPSALSSRSGVSSPAMRPSCDDCDAFAEPAGLLEVMRREQDRHLKPVAKALDQIEQLVADAGVEADRRLVQEQHLRS